MMFAKNALLDLICLEMASRFPLSQTWQVATLHHVESGRRVHVTTKDKGRHRHGYNSGLVERVIALFVVHTFPNL